MSVRAYPWKVWLDLIWESEVPRHTVCGRVLRLSKDDRSRSSDDRVSLTTLRALVPKTKISDPLLVYTERRVEHPASWRLQCNAELFC